MEYTNWAESGTDANLIRRLMSRVSLQIRHQQYAEFINLINPDEKDMVLDIGSTADQKLVDSNIFEEIYPVKKNLFLASIEDCRKLVDKYNLAGFTKIAKNRKLPFKTKSYDVVVSWATVEHVGSRRQQQKFVEEIARVGKRFFITTPDRNNPYEPHTAGLFWHWLPKNIFRMLMRRLGKDFWSQEKNLNILDYNDAVEIIKNLPGVKVKKFRLGKVLPVSLIIYK